MDLRRILRIKEVEEKEKARRLSAIEEELKKLDIEKRELQNSLKLCEKQIQESDDPLRVIHKQRAILSRLREIQEKINELENLRNKEAEELRSIKREEKAIDLLKDKLSYEEYANNLKREFLQLGFIHILKKGLKVLLILSIVAMAQSAVQNKLKEMETENREERYKELEKVIEEKLKKLIEERKKLEALKKKPLTEEEEKEVQKLVRIVSKTPSDEAGAILNEVKPRIAAEILIRLKDRQAGQILAAMDPKKAAVVTEIIMSWRKRDEQKR